MSAEASASRARSSNERRLVAARPENLASLDWRLWRQKVSSSSDHVPGLAAPMAAIPEQPHPGSAEALTRFCNFAVELGHARKGGEVWQRAV